MTFTVKLSPNDVTDISKVLTYMNNMKILMNDPQNTVGLSLASILDQVESKKETPKNGYEVIFCQVEKTANNHDCWILHKPSKKLFYAPFGHHYQIIQYLNNKHPEILAENWEKHSNIPTIRTGDVKNGHPRTSNENAVTHKVLRTILIESYNKARK